MKRLSAVFTLVFTLGVVVPASAVPTPIPGGARQVSGVAGPFGRKLFNGEVRLVPKEIRNATDADGVTAPSGQKWLVFTAAASNGTAKAFDMTQFNASIVDADGDTIQASPNQLKPMGGVYGVPPGGAWKEQILFQVPVNFVPTKIVLQPYDGKHQAFRITVRATDYKPE